MLMLMLLIGWIGGRHSSSRRSRYRSSISCYCCCCSCSCSCACCAGVMVMGIVNASVTPGDGRHMMVVMMMLRGENGCRYDRRRQRDGNGRHHRQWRRHRRRRRQPGRQRRRRRERDGRHGAVSSGSHVRSGRRLCRTNSSSGGSNSRHVITALQSLSRPLHNAIRGVRRRLWRLWRRRMTSIAVTTGGVTVLAVVGGSGGM